MRISRLIAGVLCWLMITPGLLVAQLSDRAQDTAQDTGISALWLLANLSYAGMRAQGHSSVGWRFVAFLFGIPGTLITTIVVREGGERAYGVELPRRTVPEPTGPAELRFVQRDV